jgi:hypothetical protein
MGENDTLFEGNEGMALFKYLQIWIIEVHQ